MSDSSSLRVSDAEREQLAGELREHLLAGRLSQEEFEERLDSAYGATTRAELDALKADLPLSPAALSAELARRRATLRRRVLQEASGGLVASAICVAIWLAAGASGSFWPIWVIIVTVIPVIRNAWRLYGSGAGPRGRRSTAGLAPESAPCRASTATRTDGGCRDEREARRGSRRAGPRGHRARARGRPRAPPREGPRAGEDARARACGGAARRGLLRRGGAARELERGGPRRRRRRDRDRRRSTAARSR